MPDLQTGLFFGSGHSVSLDGGRRECRDHSFGANEATIFSKLRIAAERVPKGEELQFSIVEVWPVEEPGARELFRGAVRMVAEADDSFS